ncbi:Microtubule-actin cross-linking factor 1, partial [Ophiophagus hannah]
MTKVHHNNLQASSHADICPNGKGWWFPRFSSPSGPAGVFLLGTMSSSDEETLSERSYRSEPSCKSERSYRSERSGSLSPCPPGDTLPWNLPLHEQKKRKSQDSVLDPAERAVVRVAGSEKVAADWMLVMATLVGSSPVATAPSGKKRK